MCNKTKDTSGIKDRSIAVRLIPICLSVLVTAIILQDAYGLRVEATVEDEVIPSLFHWISPLSALLLLAMYVMSIFILVFQGRSAKGSDKNESEIRDDQIDHQKVRHCR